MKKIIIFSARGATEFFEDEMEDTAALYTIHGYLLLYGTNNKSLMKPKLS